MKINAFFLVVTLLFLISCREKHPHDHSNREHTHETNTALHDDPGLPDGLDTHNEDEGNEEPVMQYTGYSNAFEIFAEAGPLVAGENTRILAHYTQTPGFNPLDSGKVTLVIQVGAKAGAPIQGVPVRKGIYSFNVKPGHAGEGALRFFVENTNEKEEVVIPGIRVFMDHKSAQAATEDIYKPSTNTVVFTKEQSWKIDFATLVPEVRPFGRVIKTTALVKPATGDEIVLVAKTSGIVTLSAGNVIEGEEVINGEKLFSVSGSSLDDNNLSVRYAEAQNNFENARGNYERMEALAEDQIVSRRELLEARNDFRNARALYENLRSNFSAGGQMVSSPMNGFIKQVLIKNGEYLEPGQPVVIVAQNKNLILSADVPQRYASILYSIVSANIRNVITDSTYTLEEMNGKILSYGKAADAGNHLIPVNFEIANNGTFIPGTFVELYLISQTKDEAVVIPNTALLEEQGNFFVWVQINPELFEKRLVFPGVTDGINIRIEQGIEPGERIVSRGAMMIKLAQSTGTMDAHSGHVH